MKLSLLPPPKNISTRSGFCQNLAVTESLVPVSRPEAGAYRLAVSKAGTTLEAADQAGLFYARQTLAQIDRQCPKRRPFVEILDWPDFPVRGFYHDVSRGKVPTLKTLLDLAETCAHHKLNQLQLYIEHTYAFQNHPEVWADAGPLTAAEIRTIDVRCAELHIDLVPSFSTFGHFYTWIHHKFPELNELESDVSGEPFTFWDRMQHGGPCEAIGPPNWRGRVCRLDEWNPDQTCEGAQRSEWVKPRKSKVSGLSPWKPMT